MYLPECQQGGFLGALLDTSQVGEPRHPCRPRAAILAPGASIVGHAPSLPRGRSVPYASGSPLIGAELGAFEEPHRSRGGKSFHGDIIAMPSRHARKRTPCFLFNRRAPGQLADGLREQAVRVTR